MNKLFLRYGLLGAALLLAAAPAAPAQRLTSYVDPMIGTGGHGHVFLGANVPFGAVQLGPQNIFKGWNWCSGYHYSDSLLIGLTHTHLSGTGCADLGDVLVMPYTGPLQTDKGRQQAPHQGYLSRYSHQRETARPGYYAVTLDDYGIRAELTSTARVGLHRYTFPVAAGRGALPPRLPAAPRHRGRRHLAAHDGPAAEPGVWRRPSRPPEGDL